MSAFLDTVVWAVEVQMDVSNVGTLTLQSAQSEILYCTFWYNFYIFLDLVRFCSIAVM